MTCQPEGQASSTDLDNYLTGTEADGATVALLLQPAGVILVLTHCFLPAALERSSHPALVPQYLQLLPGDPSTSPRSDGQCDWTLGAPHNYTVYLCTLKAAAWESGSQSAWAYVLTEISPLWNSDRSQHPLSYWGPLQLHKLLGQSQRFERQIVARTRFIDKLHLLQEATPFYLKHRHQHSI